MVRLWAPKPALILAERPIYACQLIVGGRLLPFTGGSCRILWQRHHEVTLMVRWKRPSGTIWSVWGIGKRAYAIMRAVAVIQRNGDRKDWPEGIGREGSNSWKGCEYKMWAHVPQWKHHPSQNLNLFETSLKHYRYPSHRLLHHSV